MSTIIYLTRHGQTEWNLEKRLQGRRNSPLTATGIKEAEELCMRMSTVNLNAIVSSPIERALQTANIIKGKKKLEVITEDGLMEMSFGDYEGLRVDEIMEKDSKFNMDIIMKGNISLCAPNGENLGQVRARVKEAMDMLIDKYRGKSILVVAHGITLKALMYYFNDKDVDSEVMGQATLTKVVVDEHGNFKVKFKNDVSHFTVKEEKQGW